MTTHNGIWKNENSPIAGGRVKLIDLESGAKIAIVDIDPAVDLSADDVVSTDIGRHYKITENVQVSAGIAVRCPAEPTSAP